MSDKLCVLFCYQQLAPDEVSLATLRSGLVLLLGFFKAAANIRPQAKDAAAIPIRKNIDKKSGVFTRKAGENTIVFMDCFTEFSCVIFLQPQKTQTMAAISFSLSGPMELKGKGFKLGCFTINKLCPTANKTHF